MKGLSREYLFLFNAMSGTIEETKNLQSWVTIMCTSAKQYLGNGEVTKAAEITYLTLRDLEIRLQQLQLTFIQAQQSAEEIYLADEE